MASSGLIWQVCRYPMFLAPASRSARRLRYLAPILTFPLGAGAEAYAAYSSLGMFTGRSMLLRGCVAMVVPVNVVLGGFFGYPMILAKAKGALKRKE